MDFLSFAVLLSAVHNPTATTMQYYCNYFAATLQLLCSDTATICQCHCNIGAVSLQHQPIENEIVNKNLSTMDIPQKHTVTSKDIVRLYQEAKLQWFSLHSLAT